MPRDADALIALQISAINERLADLTRADGPVTEGYPALAGLTTGQVLRATSATAAAFGALDLTNANAVTGNLPINRGGTALSSTPTNGQLLIGNGTNYTLAALTGTANRITVTNGAGTITLNGPQDLHTAATPQFGALTLGSYATPTTGDIRTPGGLYAGRDADPGDGNLAYAGDLKSYKNGSEYTGYAFVPLTSPLTSTAWDGDAYSDTGKTIIDLSAVFGAPAGIKAVLLFVAVQDSGAAANDTYMILGPTNSSLVGMAVQPQPINDRYGRYTLVVPCDSGGDIYYQIEASGAGTMDVIIQIWGYWI